MRYVSCKVLVSNSSKDLEKQETNTLALRFLTINITITHLIVCSIFGSFEHFTFDVHEPFSF